MDLAKKAWLIVLVCLFVEVGFAQTRWKMPELFGSSSTAPERSPDTDADPDVAQDVLVRSFVRSQSEVLAAQYELALAYDLNDRAALIAAEQQAISSGGVMGSSRIKNSIQLSEDADDAIAAKQAEKQQLSKEGKIHYAASLPHLAKGVVGAKQMINDAEAFFAAAKQNVKHDGLGGVTHAVTKLRVGVYLGKKTPSYSKQLFDVLRKTVSIARSNQITVPKDVTDELSDLGT